MNATFHELVLPDEHDELVAFLCGHEWPFHTVTRPTPDDVAAMSFALPKTRTFWIAVGGQRVGLVRLQDLDDIAGGDGCPVFDLRLVPAARGRGLGRQAVCWLTTTLFEEYPGLHRIEGTTRVDNDAMRHVFARCGYVTEGQLRETWPAADGTRYDTVVHGILRREWEARHSP